MTINVTCTCGNRWTSTARSGRTQCKTCRARIYIPIEVRRQAGIDPLARRPERSSIGTQRSSSRRVNDGQMSRPTSAPHRDQPPTRTLRSIQRDEPGGDTATWVSRAIVMLVAGTRIATEARPNVQPPVVPTPSAVLPDRATTSGPGTGFLILEAECGCELAVGAPSPPREIRCVRHGRTRTVRARRSSSLPPGVRYASLLE
jgi:hypothetical protein